MNIRNEIVNSVCTATNDTVGISVSCLVRSDDLTFIYLPAWDTVRSSVWDSVFVSIRENLRSQLLEL
jgi:hypothetical protein